MKTRTWLLLGIAVMAALPATAWAQEAGYPIELIAPGYAGSVQSAWE